MGLIKLEKSNNSFGSFIEQAKNGCGVDELLERMEKFHYEIDAYIVETEKKERELREKVEEIQAEFRKIQSKAAKFDTSDDEADDLIDDNVDAWLDDVLENIADEDLDNLDE